MRYPARECSIVGGLLMLQRDSLVLGIVCVLVALSTCACSGQSVSNAARRYNATKDGTLNQELAREDLERKHDQLTAAVNQACPSDTATERACEDASAKADPACQQIAKQETRWEVQGGKDPADDPAADSLLARCDQVLKQRCGFSLIGCEEAKAALKDFETRLENAEMEQAFRPAPSSNTTFVVHSSANPLSAPPQLPLMQHTTCTPAGMGFSCDTMP